MYHWGLTPEYINDQWTEELLVMMFYYMNKQMATMTEEYKPRPNYVSDKQLFRLMGAAQLGKKAYETMRNKHGD